MNDGGLVLSRSQVLLARGAIDRLIISGGYFSTADDAPICPDCGGIGAFADEPDASGFYQVTFDHGDECELGMVLSWLT